MKKVLLGLAFILIILWIILPLYTMLKISLSPPDEIMTPHPPLTIREPTLRHWKEVLNSKSIRRPLYKSLSVATLSMTLTLAIAIPGAYGISRLPKHTQIIALGTIFISRAFPEVSIALPIAIKFISWNLIDTVIGLTLAHVIRLLPIACWILVGVFQSIPLELEEQAKIDGCSKLGVLRRIVFPLSMTGIGVAAIFSWLFSWDEFTYSLYLCLSEPTLPLKVYYYINRGSWFLTATYATIITVPVIIVTYSLQRFIKSGYISGAVKG